MRNIFTWSDLDNDGEAYKFIVLIHEEHLTHLCILLHSKLIFKYNKEWWKTSLPFFSFYVLYFSVFSCYFSLSFLCLFFFVNLWILWPLWLWHFLTVMNINDQNISCFLIPTFKKDNVFTFLGHFWYGMLIF